MASETCTFCPLNLEQHRAAEASGQVNHQFSSDGTFIEVDRRQRPETKPHRVLAGADAALRLVLIEKGLVSYEELAAAEVKVYDRQRVPERPQA